MRKSQRQVASGGHHRRWLVILPLLAPLFILSLVLAARSSILSWRDPLDSTPLRLPKDLPRFAYFVGGGRGEGARLRRLLQAVYHRRNFYVVYADGSKEERADLSKFAQGNVRLMDDGKINEKGPTFLALTLHAVAILLREFDNWDWFINLSSSDYPLMPQDDIIHIFSYLPRDLNFIEHTSKLGWKEFERVRPVLVDPGLYDSNKTALFWAKEKRSVPSSFKIFVGSSGVVLTRAFLEFCIWGWDNLPRTLLLYYTNFLSSSESYFQTVICNSQEFQRTTVNHGLRFMRWDEPPRQQPAQLGPDHFNQMVESGAPFAHRFALPADTLLDRLDRELLGQTSSNRSAVSLELESVVRPAGASARLERLLVKLLDSETFWSRQCS
ncbi:beta-glucuronosyltransferase GlcAT14C-like [Wolffia australiana]